MEFKRINDDISVAEQITADDLAQIKAAGFVTIVNNRPDGEVAGQPSSAEIETASKAAGINYHFIPMGRDGVSPEMIEKTIMVLENSTGPVLCYCRTGTRSTTLWALSQAGQKPAREIIEAAAQAGYDMSHLAAHLS